MRTIIAALSLALLAPAASAVDEAALALGTTLYEGRAGPARLETVIRVRKLAGEEYEVSASTRLRGFFSAFKGGRVDEICRFREVDGRLRPLSFSRRDTLSKEGRSIEIAYDWDAGLATLTTDGGTREAPLPDGTVNSLLLPLQLRQDLATGGLRETYATLGTRGLVEHRAADQGTAGTGEEARRRYQITDGENGAVTLYIASAEPPYATRDIDIMQGEKRTVRIAVESYTPAST